VHQFENFPQSFLRVLFAVLFARVVVVDAQFIALQLDST